MKVYLIDEKKLRQKNYGWDAARLDLYKNLLVPISDKSTLDNVRKEIFADSSNVILFHDSFFDSQENRHNKQVDLIRQDMNEKSDSMSVVMFSGGITRSYIPTDNIASIPVDILYHNLEWFLKEAQTSGTNLKYLAYGRNYEYGKISFLRKELWEAMYKLNDFDAIPKFDRFEESVVVILEIIDKRNAATKLLSSQVGFFKYQINHLIKDFLNV